MAVRYRDTVTKRFVSKETWTRSKAHGGTRYKRERIKPKEEELEEPRRKKRKKPPEPPEEPDGGIIEEPEEEEEWTGAFDTP